MLRHLLRNFQRVLVFEASSECVLTKSLCQQRTFSIVQNRAASYYGGLGTFEDDTSYVAQYSVDNERQQHTSFNSIVNALRTRFRLTAADINHIMSDDVVNRSYAEKTLVNNLELLCLEGVTKQSLINYPWLITLDKMRLKQKLALINIMTIRDINDFVPFLRLSVPRLRKLVSALQKESQTIPHGNRVYFISEKLGVDAALVSKYLSKRLFVLEMPFDMLTKNLQLMVDYKVSPLNILKDLWAFRYTPKAVEMRLERAKRAKKDKIMPWMIRCPEPILQRYE